MDYMKKKDMNVSFRLENHYNYNSDDDTIPMGNSLSTNIFSIQDDTKKIKKPYNMSNTIKIIIMIIISIIISVFLSNWVYLASIIGIHCNVCLGLLFPSILYFKIGLSRDFSSMPFVSNKMIRIIPNKLFMGIFISSGLFIIIINIIILIYSLSTGDELIDQATSSWVMLLFILSSH